MSIEQQLNIKFPIYWNGAAIEEKFANYLIYKIITTRPINIVELGSGISSLIIIKTLEKLGYQYNFISIDSDSFFIEETKNLLITEGVYDEKKVKLIYAPISDLLIKDHNYKWYNLGKHNLTNIDFLFIDGPQGVFCKNSRYPAISILKRFLGRNSVIILHDAKRTDELEIVDLWKKENPEITTEHTVDTERGGVELHFNKFNLD